MKVNQEACDLRRLDLFLRGKLPPDFQRDLEDHLQVCPGCRDQLDELAGGTRWWSAVRDHLGDDGAMALSLTTDPATPPRTRSATSTLDFLQPPTRPGSLGRLGPYDILEVLGQGGMGLVLRAFDATLHRPVAIKVLAAEYAAHGTARQRFAREARAAAAVVHDHVVPVHAVDADAPLPYLVMGFIPGRSLQERIDATGPLELKEILRIGMQTAAGLAAAHAQGLVHRDIKPANIMLENGVERVRITDFGLARAVDDASVTQNGAVAGTPQYMAPEQARGEVIDQRADLFSLGSTLYAMCTGYPPFRASSTVAVLRLVSDTEAKPIRSNNPDVPAWLEGIIRKLHAKDPAARFPSATVVTELLERCLAHVQQPDRQPLPPEAEALGRLVAPPPRIPLRQRLRHWKGIAAAACLLGGTALCYSLWPFGIGTAGKSMVLESPPSAFDPMLLGAGGKIDYDLNQIEARLQTLRSEFTSPSQELPAFPDTNHTLWLRMRSLQGELAPSGGPALDPVQDATAQMWQQIQRLRGELNYLLEPLAPHQK